MNVEKIGKYIAKCRKELNLTQEALANALGITSKAVSKWECGNGLPDVAIMLDLCNELETNIINLLNGEDTKTEYYLTRCGGSMISKKAPKNKTKGDRRVASIKNYPLTKIKDISLNELNTYKVKIEGFEIIEKNSHLIANLEVSDSTGKIKAYLKDDNNLELKRLIRSINLNNIYLMRGFISSDNNTLLVKEIEKVEL